VFDERFPFYQTPDLDPSAAKPVSQIAHERASERNKSLLFDHTSSADRFPPDEAARYLLAQQNFAMYGTHSYDRRYEQATDRYAVASPLLKTAICLVRGSTVFETLMLNWHQYNRTSEVPFAFHGEDLPAWERDGGARPQGRIPDGYVDLLTWQSRRVQLIPEQSAADEVGVQQVIVMKGYWFPAAFEQWRCETMVAFRQKMQATQGEAWSPLGIEIDRTVWRDSHALFRSITGQQERPRIFDWLANLMINGWLDETRAFPLDVCGLVPERQKANVLDWRRETLPLPLVVLKDQEMVETIRMAVELAEHVAELLESDDVQLTLNGKLRKVPSPMDELCKALLAGMSGRSLDRGARKDLARHFGLSRRYWAQLDTPFRLLVNELPREVNVDAYGNRLYGHQALGRWADQVAENAGRVFRGAARDLNSSARTLRAVALAERQFRFCLAVLMAPYRPQEGAKGVSA
jgi:CRISPR system Cascade subunit CasA